MKKGTNVGLKALRIYNGYTQKELGEKTYIHYTTISDYESGKQDIKNAQDFTISKLADALNVTKEEIINTKIL